MKDREKERVKRTEQGKPEFQTSFGPPPPPGLSRGKGFPASKIPELWRGQLVQVDKYQQVPGGSYAASAVPPIGVQQIMYPGDESGDGAMGNSRSPRGYYGEDALNQDVKKGKYNGDNVEEPDYRFDRAEMKDLRDLTVDEIREKFVWNPDLKCYVEKDSKDDYNSRSQRALRPTGSMALQKRVVDNNLDRYKPGGKRKVQRPVDVEESPESAIRRKYRWKKAGVSTEKDYGDLIRERSDIYQRTNMEPLSREGTGDSLIAVAHDQTFPANDSVAREQRRRRQYDPYFNLDGSVNYYRPNLKHIDSSTSPTATEQPDRQVPRFYRADKYEASSMRNKSYQPVHHLPWEAPSNQSAMKAPWAQWDND